MYRNVCILVLYVVMTLNVMAQDNNGGIPDSSLPETLDTVASWMRPIEAPINSINTGVYPRFEYSPEYMKMKSDFNSKYSSMCIGNTPANTYITKWNGGAIYADGNTSLVPGMMGLEHGSFNLKQSIGKVSFTAFATVDKMGYFRGLQTAYGFGGSMNYEISDRWVLTLFGAYYTRVHPLTPGMIDYMPTPNFGGYASFDIDEHWGISVGAKATRSLITNRWEPQPIVMPYYKFNEKVKIGVDVGGVVYGIVKDYLDRRNGWSPVIAPPRNSPPPIAPRR